MKIIFVILILVTCKGFLVFADTEPLKSPEELDPLNDTENEDNTIKEPEKRTILKPTFKNVAWARHVAVKPSGAKFLIGYGPVDLKYQPILKPIAIKHQGYHYNRPKIHFHLKRPIIHVPQIIPTFESEWKPIIKPVPVIKPTTIPLPVPIYPEAHVKPLHLNPVPHFDHIHKEPIVPVAPPPHLEHVHHVSTAHVHYLHHTPIQHIHAVPHVHTVPEVHPPVLHTPLVPSPQLFEVAKPNLGVLPLGSVIPATPHLIPQPAVVPSPLHVHSIPHLHTPAPVQFIPSVHPIAPTPHLSPSLPVHHLPSPHPAHVNTIQHFQTPGHVFPINPLYPGDHFHHDVGHLHPVDHVHHDVGHLHPVDHVHHDVGHLHPIEHIHHDVGHLHHVDHIHNTEHIHPVSHFHPEDHFHPIGQPHPEQIPALLPQPQQHSVEPLLPNNYHLHYPQIPQPYVPAQPAPSSSQNYYPPQQQFPQDAQQPYQEPETSVYQQEDKYPYQQEDNRYQLASDVSSQQFYRENQFQIGDQRENQGYIYPQPSQGRLIQPGQTDLQFPLQLPHHPNFDRAFDQDNRPEASQQNENVFRPSIQLEPPFRK